MHDNYSGNFVEVVRRRKRMVTARTAEECIKLHYKKTYEKYKQFETEDGKDPMTIHSLNEREMTFS